ncbi:glucosyl-3-phosphoglycerate synthase [Halohasta litchfieldiae]|jgi:glucosyl-3-phosphoglycerate synthase|uniref:Glucosyl-3-phosphoglycerate synthase n=1 Tax=Halohasta litchfieldiae TaxID=1073996 RepID=A0A1H6SSG2_9EURY|nr:glycosyl transferase family 2 [Halohasta litchfieldiae]ATW86939.1 glucosyl-3-phosphoglycerate synthase [Halohasta litchfieldiae]SEI70833.1 glucosyl-3-phosphoglycerate synthase [Halohasta litchfieldiae]
MEYVQERITTLHELREPEPTAPTDRTAVVVPMTEREYGGLAAEGVLSELEAVDPARVVIPLRAPPEAVGPFCEWLDSFDLSLEVIWCSGPRVTGLLADHDLNGGAGKGRDVWLALGQVLDADYVVCHDADTKTYDRWYVPRLLFPLQHGHSFTKGYYARVENNQLYGRLFRLFYAPLIRTLADETDAPIVDYLSAFRYALAGEFAATGELISKLRVQRSWGLEIGTLGDAYAHAGFDGTAQVDLGAYEHDHRAVSGPAGLSEMCTAVGDALFRVVSDHGVDPDYDTLAGRYRSVAERFVDQYAVDAAYNELDYDPSDERDQITAYSETISQPGVDTRLPAWCETTLSPVAVAKAAAADLAAATAESNTMSPESAETVDDLH